MAGVTLTDPVRTEHQRLFDTCSTGAGRSGTVETLVNRILRRVRATTALKRRSGLIGPV